MRFSGYSEEHDEWLPRENLTPAAVNEFLKANGLYNYDNTARCPHCDRPFKSAHGVKIHLKFCTLKDWNGPQDFRGRVAEARAAEKKLEEAQEELPQVSCEGIPLDNKLTFKYLGSMFGADGDQKFDVRRRIGIAMTRMGQLRQVFSSTLPLSVKMKVYRASICSLFTYGSEAWNLDERTRAALNGANARCLSRITGRSIHEEASTRSRTFDLVAAIRRTRARWLGHILRMGPKRMLFRSAIRQHEMGQEGNLFMDVPHHLSITQTIALAQDRNEWKRVMESRIPQEQRRSKSRNTETTPAPTNAPLIATPRKTGRWFGHGADAVWQGPATPTTPTTTTTTTTNNNNNNNTNNNNNNNNNITHTQQRTNT